MGVSSSSKETNPKKESKRGKITSQPFQGLTKTILRLLESGHLIEREEGWGETSLSILHLQHDTLDYR